MPRYLALLRGVNVGGHNLVAMRDLRRVCSSLGLADVTTYRQSGNVLFSTSGSIPAAEALEQAILQELGVGSAVLLRQGAELAQIVGANPFAGAEDVDPAQLYLAFLKAEPEAGRLAAFSVPGAGGERLRVRGREIYLYHPGGYGRTKLTSGYMERHLGVTATTRNWRVVQELPLLLEG